MPLSSSRTDEPVIASDVITHDSAPEELARQWLHGIRIMHIAHGIAGERHARLARVTGVLIAVLTAVVGTALLTSDAAAQETSIQLAGILSLVTAALGLAQVAFNYPDLALRHRHAFVGYGALRRRVETSLVSGGYGGVTRNQLEDIREEWREIDASAPAIPLLVRRRARRAISVPLPRAAAPVEGLTGQPVAAG